LNPKGRYYQQLKQTLNTEFEDNYWGEDALFLERNSRDFVSRIARINKNAETISDLLRQHPRGNLYNPLNASTQLIFHFSPIVKEVYYPKYSPTKPYYDNCRCENGGYGGLLSVTFYSREDAIAVFDTMEVSKGPSLGTNFTLASPYTLLAHYGELDWAAQFGVASDLIRISVGLEETEELVDVLNRALAVL
jgi:cystathionine gamma-synthase